MMFPLEKMLISVSRHKTATLKTLLNIRNKIEIMNIRELSWRDKITSAGIKKLERLTLERSDGEEDDEYECHICNANLYLSMIANEEEDQTFCLPHGLQHIKSSKKRLRQCKLMYLMTRDELKEVLNKLVTRINTADYVPEPPLDPPLKAEEMSAMCGADDDEDDKEDDADSADPQTPRQRALPSFIKKEVASSSEETDDDDTETECEAINVRQERTIGPEDYTDFQNIEEEDIPLVEALFMENDEIIRPSERRHAPRQRKPLSETDESQQDDEEEGNEEEEIEDVKTLPKPRKTAQPKKIEAKTKLETGQPAKGKGKRRKSESDDDIVIEEVIEVPKKKPKTKMEETEHKTKSGKEATHGKSVTNKKSKMAPKSRMEDSSPEQPSIKKGKIVK